MYLFIDCFSYFFLSHLFVCLFVLFIHLFFLFHWYFAFTCKADTKEGCRPLSCKWCISFHLFRTSRMIITVKLLRVYCASWWCSHECAKDVVGVGACSVSVKQLVLTLWVWHQQLRVTSPTTTSLFHPKHIFFFYEGLITQIKCSSI